jgi:serine/threonine protein kinase/Tol biopolymer transport system component
MQFTPGFRLGSYEVIAAVAAGGMGEVYRARDTVLGRDVAIKVLSRSARADAEHRARFEREARAVAALSHPNILAIYGFGYQDGIAYAVIEWLEGHTLREELVQGRIALRRAIDLGAQMALGLSAAHDKSLAHRDFKPENVFVTLDGVVKLLDFGLAKIVSDSRPGFALDPVRSDAITSEGTVLGTVGYMSPEQVSGSVADLRSDVFSLGIVLFEMLTGQRPFRRESAVETLSATVKEAPPPVTALTPGVPIPLERIVMRCLEKSPAERFQSARDLAFALSALATPTSAPPAVDAPPSESAMKNRGWFIVAFAVVIGLWLAAVTGPRFWAIVRSNRPPLVSFTIAPPAGTVLANVPSKMLAISPDGDRIVFAVTRAGRRELWMRDVASTQAEPLPGTQDASEPFWSPDGQHIGFFADSKLKRMSIDGTMPATLCDAPLEARGATWNTGGTILFSDAYGGLSRVAATGGVPTRVTTPDREQRQETDSWPQFLPDGHRFLYLRQRGPSTELGAAVYLGTLDGTSTQPLLAGVFNALFLPPGALVFADANAVKVQRVDLDRGQMVGDIEELSLDVDRHLGHAALTLSRGGTLAYAAAGSQDHRLVWVDRHGHETGIVAPDDGWRDIALSPDGLNAAVQRIVPDANDIWTIDLARGVPSRFTFSPDVDDDPVWSPDGTTVVFSSVRDGVPGIYQKRVHTAADDDLLFTNHGTIHPSAWSPDGRVLLFEQTDPASGSDIWVLPVQGDRTPHPYLATRFSEGDAQFSPDGKWVAYTSDESGRNEVYVQSFPDLRQSLQISTGGGVSPRWAPSGRELYFLSNERRLMAVKITRANPLQVGTPTPLFDTSVGLGENRYVPTSDGNRFLLNVGTAEGGSAQLVVVLNWAAHVAIMQPAR